MAQKSAKTLASRNTSRLHQTHLTTLAVHTFHLLTRLLLFRSTLTRRSIALWLLLSLPALAIEAYLDKVGRPTYIVRPDGTKDGVKELKRPGEDLEAQGVMEWAWDVVYWSWGCTGLAAVLGDWGWSIWVSLFGAVGVYVGLMGWWVGCCSALYGLELVWGVYWG
ncbi:hypothetical protein BT63DRAFT_430481 [Microthyrium microscopicum]|uniref:Uncharacterized protein n=1 Tax=Microthyrium microscopicum TaxID=703497 RepID=A0A6A6TXB3_9PEZI|nr:hypothetical protein BT63DRAFT_430481 [Microthyrium microscopicum]